MAILRIIKHRIMPWQAKQQNVNQAARLLHTPRCRAAAAAQDALDMITPAQHDRMLLYLDAVLEHNRHTNLTGTWPKSSLRHRCDVRHHFWHAHWQHWSVAVRDREDAIEKHIHDSLALLPALDAHVPEPDHGGQLRLIDVGSGAGFPGVILALARPLWQVGL